MAALNIDNSRLTIENRTIFWNKSSKYGRIVEGERKEGDER